MCVCVCVCVMCVMCVCVYVFYVVSVLFAEVSAEIRMSMQEMRELGDSYARNEFKAHKKAQIGQVHMQCV